MRVSNGVLIVVVWEDMVYVLYGVCVSLYSSFLLMMLRLRRA